MMTRSGQICLSNDEWLDKHLCHLCPIAVSFQPITALICCRMTALSRSVFSNANSLSFPIVYYYHYPSKKGSRIGLYQNFSENELPETFVIRTLIGVTQILSDSFIHFLAEKICQSPLSGQKNAPKQLMLLLYLFLAVARRVGKVVSELAGSVFGSEIKHSFSLSIGKILRWFLLKKNLPTCPKVLLTLIFHVARFFSF